MVPSSTLTSSRATRWAILCAVIAAFIVFCVFSYAPSLSARVLTTSSTGSPAPPITRATGARHAGQLRRAPNGESLSSVGASGPDAADGVLPGPVSVFSNDYVGITNLNPQLLAALRRAASEANRYGITTDVDSGWRSKAYQEQLFEQAVARYGSAEAARWVARPGTSVHEAGYAVDIGGGDAAAWLARNGSGYGLCPMYGNEPWHFEWRPEAVAQGCPTMYADPTRDPRLGK